MNAWSRQANTKSRQCTTSNSSGACDPRTRPGDQKIIAVEAMYRENDRSMHMTMLIRVSLARLFLVSISLGSLDYPGSNIVHKCSS
jgi:hypothetical protein